MVDGQPAEIRYAASGDVSIAYAVTGSGPVDLVFVHGFAGNLDVELESAYYRHFHERLVSFSRLILFDRRGAGLSDRMREAPTLETRMDDLRAVLDAVDSERAVLFGTFEAASMCLLFAATYPERTLALVLYNPVARGTWAPDYPWANQWDEWRGFDLDTLRREWGTFDFVQKNVRVMAPSRADDPQLIHFIARMQRLGASPGSALTIMRMATNVDVRDVLPAIRVPTLILNMPSRRGEAEHVAARIVGADSTAKAAELGDRAWADLVARHHALVRRQLDQFRGSELDTAGDGFFATFDGPIRAIRCARAITDSMGEIGLRVRAGLHTGECELVNGKVAGIAVNIGARIAARAAAEEVLVTQTVKDLVAGSDLAFEDRGVAELKGVPGEWRLYAVADAAA